MSYDTSGKKVHAVVQDSGKLVANIKYYHSGSLQLSYVERTDIITRPEQHSTYLLVRNNSPLEQAAARKIVHITYGVASSLAKNRSNTSLQVHLSLSLTIRIASRGSIRDRFIILLAEIF